MNGAEQQIFEDLLATVKVQTDLLKKLSDGFKRTEPSSNGVTGLKGFADKINLSTIALNALTGAFNIISDVISGLANIVGRVVGAFLDLAVAIYDMAKATADGTTKLSDFFNAFKGVPLLGTFFGIIGDIIGVQEKYLDSYQKLSRTGATLTGDLADVTRAARMAGLSLSELQDLVGKSSDVFAGLGAGNVNEGYKKFLSANQEILRTSGRELFGLGYTAADISESLTTVAKIQMRTANGQSMTAQDIAKYSKDYLVTLDSLTRLTGIQRDELEKQEQKRLNDQLWQTHLAGLSTEQRIAQEAMVRSAGAVSEELATQLQANLRGANIPVTEAGRGIATLSNGMSLMTEDLRKASLTGNLSQQQAQKMALEWAARVAAAQGRMINVAGETMAAVGGLSGLYDAGLQKFNLTLQTSGKTSGQILDQITKDQAKAAKGTAGSLQQSEQAMKFFGMDFMGRVAEAFTPLMPALRMFADSMISIINSIAGSRGLKDAIKELAAWLTKFIEDISRGWKTGGLTGAISAAFGDILSGFSGIFEEYLKPAFAKLIDYMWEHISAHWHWGGVQDVANKDAQARLDAMSDTQKKQYQAYIDWLNKGGAGREKIKLTNLYQNKTSADFTTDQLLRGFLESQKRGQFTTQPKTTSQPPAAPNTEQAKADAKAHEDEAKKAREEADKKAKSDAHAKELVKVQQPEDQKFLDKDFRSLSSKSIIEAVNKSNYLLALIAENTDSTHRAIKEQLNTANLLLN